MSEAKITGVFEHVIGTDNAEETIKYWNELGFKVIQEGQFSKEDTKELYGVEAPLKSYRLRCGNFDTHGNLRIFVWDKFVIKDSPSFTNALSPGNRWVTQRTEDIFGVTYAYDDCAKRGGKWIVSDLVRNYLGATGVGKNFYDRYKGVYEVLIHGIESKQVFFQRVGYKVEGYGTIPEDSPLLCSEFTHGGVVVRNLENISFYTEVLGLIDEGKTLQGSPRKMGQESGPFMVDIGYGYNAHTIVSPNQKTGRIYYAMPIYDFDNISDGGKPVMDVIKQATKSTNETVDWIEHCRPGVRGLCTSTYKAKDVEELYSRVVGSAAISVTKLLKNEFGEKSFSFTAPDGVFWNIIDWE